MQKMGPRKVGAHFCQNPKIAGKESFAWLKFVGFDKLMRKLESAAKYTPSKCEVRCGDGSAGSISRISEPLSVKPSHGPKPSKGQNQRDN